MAQKLTALAILLLEDLGSSSRESSVLFCPPWTLHACGTQTHTGKTHTHNRIEKK